MPTLVAAETGFIEVQAPIVYAPFFIWFVRYFAVPLLGAAHVLGADWGLDALFCRAARMYASEYHRPRGGVRAASRAAGAEGRGAVCAVALVGPPLTHTNTHALDTKFRPASSSSSSSSSSSAAASAAEGGAEVKRGRRGGLRGVSRPKVVLNHALMGIIARRFPRCGACVQHTHHTGLPSSCM